MQIMCTHKIDDEKHINEVEAGEKLSCLVIYVVLSFVSIYIIKPVVHSLIYLLGQVQECFNHVSHVILLTTHLKNPNALTFPCLHVLIEPAHFPYKVHYPI